MNERPPAPRNVAKELDDCTRERGEVRTLKLAAYQAWKNAEAKKRVSLRAIDDLKGERWASADVAAAITMMRNDPTHEIGKRFQVYSELRAHLERLEADKDILERANWDAINRGRFGA